MTLSPFDGKTRFPPVLRGGGSRLVPEGIGCDVRGHREQIADEARQEVSEDEPEDSASAAADPHGDSAGMPTGEEQAATNRDEDPPA